MEKKIKFLITILVTGLFLSINITGAEKLVNDFSLKSVADNPVKTFKLSEHKGKYVILHFLLKTKCPICTRLTRDYYTQLKDNHNLVQVFIKPDSEEQIKNWLGNTKDRPAIYRDPDAALAKELKIPNGYKFHGEVVHYPAFILINPEGKEVFRYIGKGTRDRYTYQKFAKAYPKLVKK